jgi:PAS domain S-box-containing protein
MPLPWSVSSGVDFRLAVDAIPSLVWITLADGHVEYLNKRWIEYTGFNSKDAVGWGWEAAIHPDDLPGLMKYWVALLASGKAGETEARLRRFDGVYLWYLFRAIPLHNDLGHVFK